MTPTAKATHRDPASVGRAAAAARPSAIVKWTWLSAVTLLLTTWAAADSGELTAGTLEDGRHFWAWQGRVMQIKLTQLLPVQIRAFYQARGFTSAQAEQIAQGCAFQVIGGNRTATPATWAETGSGQWQLHTPSGAQSPPTLEEWQNIWDQQKVNTAAQIAFRWSLFPAQQKFHGGDHNWGIFTTGLSPGDTYKLVMHWSENGIKKSATLHDIECAVDR